jgi:hypothetical protein
LVGALALGLALALPGAQALGKKGGGGKPGGGGGETPTGTVYLGLGASVGAQVHSLDAGGGVPTTLPGVLAGEPSHDLHNGSRWFLSLRRVAGTNPDGQPRWEAFAVRDDAVAVQLTDQADLELRGDPSNRFADLRWSPDDSQISFVALRWDSQTVAVAEAGIYVVDVRYDASDNVAGLAVAPATPAIASRVLGAGGDPRWIRPEIGGHDWSPDGAQVVHNRRLPTPLLGMALELTIASVAGGGSTTFATRAAAGRPVWSPDGSVIAYDSDTGDIHTIHPDGTSDASIVRHRGGGNWIHYDVPRWSPTGGHLVCVGGGSVDRDSRHDIYRFSATGGGKTNLTSGVDTRYLSGTPATPLGWR